MRFALRQRCFPLTFFMIVTNIGIVISISCLRDLSLKCCKALVYWLSASALSSNSGYRVFFWVVNTKWPEKWQKQEIEGSRKKIAGVLFENQTKII